MAMEFTSLATGREKENQAKRRYITIYSACANYSVNHGKKNYKRSFCFTSGLARDKIMVSLTPRPDGTGAAEPCEPRQVREEAAVRRITLGAAGKPVRTHFLTRGATHDKHPPFAITKAPITRPPSGRRAGAPMKTPAKPSPSSACCPTAASTCWNWAPAPDATPRATPVTNRSPCWIIRAPSWSRRAPAPGRLHRATAMSPPISTTCPLWTVSSTAPP